MSQESPKWTDKAIVILTVGIVVAAILQTRIFEKQWKEMHDSGTDTHDLALAAKAQADAAKAQADRTKDLADRALVQTRLIRALTDEADRANDIALGAMEANERAWVSVEVGEKTGNFSVTMRNTGKSPAINVTSVTAFSGGKRMGPPEVDLSQNSSSGVLLPKNAPPGLLEQLKKEGFIRDRPPSGYVIAPGDTQIASDYQGKFTQLFKIEGDRVYVQGRVTYTDIFGKSRETLFCYWFAPPSDFVMCNDHNKMN